MRTAAPSRDRVPAGDRQQDQRRLESSDIQRFVGRQVNGDRSVMAAYAAEQRQSAGMSRIMTQAPSANFETSTMMSVTAVQTAPRR